MESVKQANFLHMFASGYQIGQIADGRSVRTKDGHAYPITDDRIAELSEGNYVFFRRPREGEAVTDIQKLPDSSQRLARGFYDGIVGVK